MSVLPQDERIRPRTPMPTILIVEDNRVVTRALATLLKDAGFQGVVFHEAAPAMEFIQHTQPWAAVVDIHLPDISGLILTQKFREQCGPEMPIVILSGDTSMETLNSLPHIGATYFFSKPVNSAHLIEKLKGWVSAG